MYYSTCRFLNLLQAVIPTIGGISCGLRAARTHAGDLSRYASMSSPFGTRFSRWSTWRKWRLYRQALYNSSKKTVNILPISDISRCLVAACSLLTTLHDNVFLFIDLEKITFRQSLFCSARNVSKTPRACPDKPAERQQKACFLFITTPRERHKKSVGLL